MRMKPSTTFFAEPSSVLLKVRRDIIVRRTTYFRGKPVRMWRNEPLLRLVRSGTAHIEARPATGGDAALHERLLCDGPVGELNGTLLHYSYPDRASYQRKFKLYTSIEAAGSNRNPLRAVRETLLGPVRFARNLLRRGALLDGPRGWYVAWYSAWYPAVVAWKSGNIRK